MGKRKSKRDRLPPFVPLTMGLLNSSAYINLTPSAGKALPYFFAKVKVNFNYLERYETVFNFSYSEAKRYGFSSANFSRVCKQLVEIGFIEYVEKGGLRGEELGYNKYRLSKKWESYGKEKPPERKPIPWPLATPIKAEDTPVVKKTILIKRKVSEPVKIDDKPETKKSILIRRKIHAAI